MQSRRILAAWAIGAGVASALAQQPGPFADGDPQRGHALVDKDCHECHVRLFGDQDRIYTRADRRVTTPAQLRSQIVVCNTQLGSGYFPDEEEHIAAWLNQRYYGFKP
jgi:mono/diheme cytochrome c family protein